MPGTNFLIAHLETGRHLYGGARQAGYLIEGLAARGVDNVAICAADSALADRLEGRPRIEVLRWPVSGDLDVRLGSRLAGWLRARRPDLLHVHSRRAADRAGGPAARAAGVPAILTRRVQSTESAFWLRRKCRHYAAVVAISKAVGAEIERAGVPADRTALIQSAVDARLFRPDAGARGRLLERYALPADACIAGTAAQLIPRKGQDFLLELMPRLTAAEPRLRLLLFGRGPSRARLERRAARLGLADRVRFCGFADDWPALLPGLDLFVHPARREGLGAVVLEAMSAGVPVVAAAAGGIVDLIADGVDGRLLPPDDAPAWLGALRGLAGDAAARARLARAARQKVRSDFTIDAMIASYLALYRHVAG